MTPFYTIKDGQYHIDVAGMVNAKRGLFVAVPVQSQLHAQTAMALTRLQKFMASTGLPFNIHFHTNNSIISLARNMSVAEFMAKETYSHLLFVDSDIVFDERDPIRMMSANLPVLGGVYARKYFFAERLTDFIGNVIASEGIEKGMALLRGLGQGLLDHATEPVCSAKPGGDRQDFAVEALSLPAGFLMVNRYVIDHLIHEHPDRHIEMGLTGNDNVSKIEPFLYDLFCYGFDENGYHGEDVGFCRLCQAHGIKIYADTLAKLEHIGTWPFRSDPARLLKQAEAV